MTSTIELSRTQGDYIFYGGVATAVIGTIVAAALIVIARHGNIPKLNYGAIGAFGSGLGVGTMGVIFRCFQKDRTHGLTTNEQALRAQITQKETDLQEAQTKYRTLEGQLGEAKGNLQQATAKIEEEKENAKRPLLEVMQKLTEERDQLQQNIDVTQQQVQDLTGKLEAAKKQVQDSIRQKDQAAEQLRVLQETNKKEIDKIAKEFAAENIAKKKLEAEVQQLHTELETAKQAAQPDAPQQIQQLKDALAQVQVAAKQEKDDSTALVTTLSNEKGLLVEANKKLAAEIEELKKENTELETSKEQCRSEAQAFFDEKEEATRNLKAAKERIVELEAQLEKENLEFENIEKQYRSEAQVFFDEKEEATRNLKAAKERIVELEAQLEAAAASPKPARTPSVPSSPAPTPQNNNNNAPGATLVT